MLDKSKHFLAKLVKTEQEYKETIQAMINAGFKPFALSGFSEGAPFFVAYSALYAVGKPQFTDGASASNAENEVQFIETIEDFVALSKEAMDAFNSQNPLDSLTDVLEAVVKTSRHISNRN